MYFGSTVRRIKSFGYATTSGAFNDSNNVGKFIESLKYTAIKNIAVYNMKYIYYFMVKIEKNVQYII